MFERYTEQARRVIFFARYEASMCGGESIDPEHLALALIREDPRISAHFSGEWTVEAFRKEVEASYKPAPKRATSVDIPLSQTCKRILTNASALAEGAGHRVIDTVHLMIALLRDSELAVVKLLLQYGVSEELVSVDLARVRTRRPGSSPEDQVLAILGEGNSRAAKLLADHGITLEIAQAAFAEPSDPSM